MQSNGLPDFKNIPPAPEAGESKIKLDNTYGLRVGDKVEYNTEWRLRGVDKFQGGKKVEEITGIQMQFGRVFFQLSNGCCVFADSVINAEARDFSFPL